MRTVIVRKAQSLLRVVIIATLLISLVPVSAVADDAPVATEKKSSERSIVLRDARVVEHAQVKDIELEKSVILRGLELRDSRKVDLELERFDVLTEDAQLIEETPAGERPMARPDVVLLRGGIKDEAGSHAYLAVSPHGTHGYVKTDTGIEILSTGPHHSNQSSRFRIEVTNAFDITSGQAAGLSCGNEHPELALMPLGLPQAAPDAADGGEPAQRGVRVAIDSDFEFTADLFDGNAQAAMTYILVLFGAMSDIYDLNLNTRINVPYAKVRSGANDPYTITGVGNMYQALLQFESYWNANRGNIDRELAHLLSGKELGGGIAYLGVVCNSTFGYGLSANMNGTFPYPVQHHNSGNWDIMVISHEIGHNFGAAHTHDYQPPVDACGLGDCSNAFEGTIMSYCHTCPGGIANIELNFHPTVQANILSYLNSLPSSCDLLLQQCVADANGDLTVNFNDIFALFAAWGECANCPQDLDGNGAVNFEDVLMVLGHWGDCT